MVRPRWRGSFRSPQAWMMPAGSRTRVIRWSAAARAASRARASPVRAPGGDAAEGVEEPEVVGVQVDAAGHPRPRSCPRGTARPAGSASSPVRSWASQSMPGPEARGPADVGALGLAGARRPERVAVRRRWCPRGTGRRRSAMFASTVRSAAATAAAVASASELGRTSVAVMDAVLPRVSGRVPGRCVVGVPARWPDRCSGGWRCGRRWVERGAQREAAVGPHDVEQRRGGEAERDRGAGREDLGEQHEDEQRHGGEVPAAHRQVQRTRAARRAAARSGRSASATSASSVVATVEHDQRSPGPAWRRAPTRWPQAARASTAEHRPGRPMASAPTRAIARPRSGPPGPAERAQDTAGVAGREYART